MRQKWPEFLRDKRPVRSSVNVFYDWIITGGVKVGWSDDDTPDVSLAITSLGGKNLRSLPTRLNQVAYIAELERGDISDPSSAR